MSYPLIAAWRASMVANSALVALLSTSPDSGGPAIYPYHFRTIKNPTYPLITIARFGDGLGTGRFDDDPLHAARMERPRIAICVFAQKDLDQAYAIYQLIDPERGKSFTTQYVSSWRVDRTLMRDDLFDQDANAYHIHSEWITWTEIPIGISIPINP